MEAIKLIIFLEEVRKCMKDLRIAGIHPVNKAGVLPAQS
jgi:hypothetical protein